MSSVLNNLSSYNAEELPSADDLRSQRFGIAVSDWNSDITFELLKGAVETLEKSGVMPDNIEVYHVPGAFELTFAARKMADSDMFNAVIAIGCVIKGDTPHFDYICQAVTQGITSINEDGVTPVIFSVLTTFDKQQALDRAGGKLGNKGVEGAVTAMKMANLF
ncbi:MAG: 6,7-dimethyl-8-ribityllumazine synthase [Paludibacteraceae bacterium]|nr:6,7-dimethyl-8-ribityllumazine synthase [Paludibacteraceae bacterium]